jgi:hypothetical protein
MTIALSAINPRNVGVLRVLDALLARHEDPGDDRDRLDVDVDILSLRLHLQVCGDAISAAQIELADDGASALQALRWHLGPDVELATMHRRVHRWLVDGREVILDSFNGQRTCLRFA